MGFIKKTTFIMLMPAWTLYVAFGIIYYVQTGDDMHFSAMSDIASWWLDGWGGI